MIKPGVIFPTKINMSVTFLLTLGTQTEQMKVNAPKLSKRVKRDQKVPNWTR